jgi:Raf kinase inhibitor-like YbhB/YbcL family protein
MRLINSTLLCVLTLGVALVAQTPAQRPAGNQPPGAPAAPGGPGGPGPGGQRRGPTAVMTLTSTAWPDGGQIPRKYTQAGSQTSTPLAWSNVPDGVQSFVLIVRDLDQVAGNADDTLHWLLWNIPGSSRELPEGVPQGTQLPDGTRQISASGPYFRGPGAPAAGPAHHYVFELYAVDGPINVPAVGQSPAETRAAVFAAMAGRVRAKGVYAGLFKR